MRQQKCHTIYRFIVQVFLALANSANTPVEVVLLAAQILRRKVWA